MQRDKLFEKGQNFVGTKGLVFFDDNKVLVYTRDSNTDFFPFYLDLPGGGSEFDETPFETFERELKEEFNLAVSPEDVSYGRAYPAQKDPTKTGYFLVAKLQKTAATGITFGDEGIEYKIVNLNDLLQDEKLIPSIKQRIDDYLSYTQKSLRI